jgi:acetylglutamate kinase
VNVLKVGGELVQTEAQVAALADLIRDWQARGPLVFVHGGGKEIDAALTRAGIDQRRAEGLRITDAPTLDVVVAVLAGTVNTRIVAGLVARGIRAVGLTGADAGLGLSKRAGAYRTAGGAAVDLGLVGEPVAEGDASLLAHLASGGYVPVVASIGVTAEGALLNVNADVLAARRAAAQPGPPQVNAGTTAGVLDAGGRTIDDLDLPMVDALVAGGTATDGMVAKLSACRAALAAGVGEVLLVDGRTLAAPSGPRGTRIKGTVTSSADIRR